LSVHDVLTGLKRKTAWSRRTYCEPYVHMWPRIISP